MISRIWKFIAYWYFRYTVVTELYMVERWERHTIHVLFSSIFLALWYFNYAVLLTGVSRCLGFAKMDSFDNMRTISAAS